MPQLIEYIDAIARQKRRAVLYVTFRENGEMPRDFRHFPPRVALIAWLDQQGIAWQECGPFADPAVLPGYRGQLYLDVPMDQNDPRYRLLCQHLEHPDGSMRIECVRFCYLPLNDAMENAHHDEPGFWDRWADKF